MSKEQKPKVSRDEVWLIMGRHKRNYQHRFGISYPFQTSRDCSMIARLLGNFTVEHLLKLNDLYFRTNNRFIVNAKRYDIPFFEYNISTLAIELQEQPKRPVYKDFTLQEVAHGDVDKLMSVLNLNIDLNKPVNISRLKETK